MVRAVRNELGPHTPASRIAMLAALAWAGSAVVHIGVFAIDGGSLSGAVSWRKPIVFSISVGLTLWAVGWVLDRMPTPRPRLARALAWTFAAAATVETSLGVTQAWRGRASHFNVFATGDAAIFGAMGLFVAVMSVVLVVLFVWTLVEPPRDAATRWAVHAGLAAVVAGLGLGQWLIDLGFEHVRRFGAVPPVVMHGDAVAKFPHAVAFHGIQIFAVLLALTNWAAIGGPRRSRALRIAVAGYVGLLAFATLQSVAGLAPLALRPWSVVLVAASLCALGSAFSTVLLAGHRSRRGVAVSLPT